MSTGMLKRYLGYTNYRCKISKCGGFDRQQLNLTVKLEYCVERPQDTQILKFK